MKTLSKKEFRSEIEKMGFKVSFKSVDYTDLLRKTVLVPKIKDREGNERPSMYFNQAQIDKWKPVNLFMEQNQVEQP